MSSRLEVDVRLIEVVGGVATTVQEGTFKVGEDMRFDRLQEHANNCLRQLVNRYQTLERTKS
jgi:hypothetical protein